MKRVAFTWHGSGGQPVFAARAVEKTGPGQWGNGGVCGVWTPNFGHGRDHLSGHSDSVTGLVSCYVVGDGTEEWCQRVGAATCVGAEEV